MRGTRRVRSVGGSVPLLRVSSWISAVNAGHPAMSSARPPLVVFKLEAGTDGTADQRPLAPRNEARALPDAARNHDLGRSPAARSLPMRTIRPMPGAVSWSISTASPA